jgi:hypothetical protein
MSSRLGLRYNGQSFGNGLKCACHSRRGVLAGIAAIGTVAALWPAAAQTSPTSGSAIDPAVIEDLVWPTVYLPTKACWTA